MSKIRNDQRLWRAIVANATERRERENRILRSMAKSIILRRAEHVKATCGTAEAISWTVDFDLDALW